MPALGVDASDLAVLLCAALAGLALSLPLGLVIVAAQASPNRGTAPWPWTRPRHRHRAGAPHQAAGRRRRDRDAIAPPGVMPQRGRDAFHAAQLHTGQLRRAAAIVRLFAAAPSGGEREAAYQALVRLADVADMDLVASSPGALYRTLVQAGSGAAGALAFDARVCAELDRRDAVHAQGRS